MKSRLRGDGEQRKLERFRRRLGKLYGALVEKDKELRALKWDAPQANAPPGWPVLPDNFDCGRDNFRNQLEAAMKLGNKITFYQAFRRPDPFPDSKEYWEWRQQNFPDELALVQFYERLRELIYPDKEVGMN